MNQEHHGKVLKVNQIKSDRVGLGSNYKQSKSENWDYNLSFSHFGVYILNFHINSIFPFHFFGIFLTTTLSMFECFLSIV